MVEGSIVKIHMKKILLKGMILDKNVYTCKVDSYDAQEEKFVISVSDVHITKLLLDAIYQCDINVEGKIISCEGRIKERYQSEDGSMAVLYLSSGFY